MQLGDSSLVLIQNQGVLPTGTLKVNATESLEIADINPSGRVYSGIWSETLGWADGWQVIVSTPQLALQSSGQIFSSTYGAAKAADITLSVPKALRVIGLLPNQVGGGTIVGSFALGSGQSGNITISTLAVRDRQWWSYLECKCNTNNIGCSSRGFRGHQHQCRRSRPS